MKRPFPTVFLILACAVLMVFGILYGAYHGWQQEAGRVEALFKQTNGIETMLLYRANDAANLNKVALRHMPASDPLLKQLLESRNAVSNGKASLHERFLANEQLHKAAEELEQALNKKPSFTASARDTNYVSAILRDMEQLASSGAQDLYNSAAKDYNNRFLNSVSGILSRLMSVKAAQIFE